MQERSAAELIAIIQHMRREVDSDWRWQGENCRSGDNGSVCICCGGMQPEHEPDCIIPELPSPWA